MSLIRSDVHLDVILSGFKKAGFTCNVVKELTNYGEASDTPEYL